MGHNSLSSNKIINSLHFDDNYNHVWRSLAIYLHAGKVDILELDRRKSQDVRRH